MEVQGGLQVGRNVAPGQRMQVQRSRVGQMLSNLTTSRVIVGEQHSGSGSRQLSCSQHCMCGASDDDGAAAEHAGTLAAHRSPGRGRLVPAHTP